MENRVKELASNLLRHSVRLKAGEKILIEMLGTDCVDLAKELISQAKEIGAIPLFNITTEIILSKISSYIFSRKKTLLSTLFS